MGVGVWGLARGEGGSCIPTHLASNDRLATPMILRYIFHGERNANFVSCTRASTIHGSQYGDLLGGRAHTHAMLHNP